MHSTDDLNDSYLGSGLRLLRSVKKHGADQHNREILEDLPTREAASAREKELITEEMRKDPECLNCGAGGLGAVDLPPVKEDARAKISAANTRRFARERAIRHEALQSTLYTMTHEEILKELVLPNGSLNKNATRNLKPRAIPASTREAHVAKKWNFIHEAIRHPNFPEASDLELINRYVHQIEARPVCKICSAPVTFFRFNQPYAIYCGARCQLSDPSQKNPVIGRWAK
jgi:hypothetical protein